MDLAERVAELEQRVAALEGEAAPPGEPTQGQLWALHRLQEEFAAADTPDGGVLFTGSVRLPTREEYAWQVQYSTEEMLSEDWTVSAEVLSALGSPVRLRLLQEILNGRRTAAELSGLDGVGTSGQIYHHLRQLAAVGWLQTAGRGRFEVPAQRVVPLLIALASTRR